MSSITENRPFLYSVLMASGAVLTLITRFIPDICDQFEVVPFPYDVRHKKILFTLAQTNILCSFSFRK
jgi:hypothetical protein